MLNRSFLKLLSTTLSLALISSIANATDSCTREGFRKTISRSAQPIRYDENFWPRSSRVLLMGEWHLVASYKKEIISQLRKFKEQGLTHLALEMIPQEYQKDVDRYLDKGDRDSKANLWGILNEDWGTAPDLYLETVTAARELGIKVVALDILDTFEKRNEAWMRVLIPLLQKNKDARVLVFCGVNHAANYVSGGRTNRARLKDAKIESTTANFAGGNKIIEAIDPTDVNLSKEVAWGANLSGYAEKAFTLDTRGCKNSGVDFVVHLPQIGN